MGDVNNLRRAVVTIKLFPFFYVFGLLLMWLLYPVMSETALSIIDSLIFVSALTVAFLIRLSFCVGLCKWHRLQCSLPLLPQATALIDEHICEFGSCTAMINYSLMIAIAALSLVNIYKMTKPASASSRQP